MNNTNLETSTLLNIRPFLLLNKTLVSIHWVDSLIRKSPSLIASKEGTVFPPEIWNMIIDFAIGPSITRHHHVLVRPAEVQPTSNNGALLWDIYVQKGLLCNLARGPYRPKGILCHVRSERSQYISYLANPDKEAHKMKQFPLDLPYGTGQTITFALPENSRIKFLFSDYGIPELIARLQKGHCRVCRGDRVYTFRDQAVWNYEPCKTCLDDSDTTRVLYDQDYRMVSGSKERWEAYGAKLVARQKELGYLDD